MSEEIEDPLTTIEEKKGEPISESLKEIETQDILVCGTCHGVFYLIEEFQEHKSSNSCKENGELKETLKDEKRVQIWGFTLWKNAKFHDTKEEEKSPTSWSLYQNWRNLEAGVKDVWLKAGENIQALCEISNKFEVLKKESDKSKIYILQNSETKGEKSEEMLENEEEESECTEEKTKEKDPLGMDGESGPESDSPEKAGEKKTILKPVQMNSKVTIITRKPRTTRKAVRTGSDPKVEHVVEKIVSKRYNPRKRTFEYLLKWENFDAEKNTWEPVANLHNCKAMLEEFEKSWQLQKEQIRLQKMLAKKAQNQKKAELLQYSEGRPQRTSKQKALNQVKQWCGNMEADENSGKRVFSDDSDDDDSFEKRMKYEEYSSDSENDSNVVTIKRIAKPQNGVEKKAKLENITLPDNILIPDAKGIVRINQKQIPSLSSGVYVMSKTAGIIKLDTKASKLATSGGQTVLKVAPKIGQTSIKVIKKEVSNGTTTTTKTANILRTTKPIVRNYYSSRVYMQKRNNAQNMTPKKLPDVPKDEDKEDDESDGIEELEFPTDIPIPAPDSPPPEFTLCPLTGKVIGKDGQVIEEPEEKVLEEVQSANDNTAALDNLVNMAAADILEDLEQSQDKLEKDENKDEKNDEKPGEASMCTKAEDSEVPMKNESESSLQEQAASIDIATPALNVAQSQADTKAAGSDSILSTALTNANISVKRPLIQKSQNRTIINRTVGPRPAPQAIITRITPGGSPMQRSRVMAPKPKESPIIRKRTIISNQHSAGSNRSLVRRIGDTKIYTPSGAGQSQVSSFVATPTKSNIVISMPSLTDADAAAEKTETDINIEIKQDAVATPQKQSPAQNEAATSSTQSPVSLNNLALGDPETPLLITGEDGTIYQVAGQNEEGQTILITHGEDGEQQCLLVAPENAGLINQALMKPAESETEQVQIPTPAVEEPISINTEPEEATDDSQVVAQIVSANPPSPGGTRKVVLMLPDGNFMMTEVTAEQYAALELDK